MAKKQVLRPAQNVLPKNFIPTPEQKAIGDWIEKGEKNLVVLARAGTGKTTTLVYMASRLPARFKKIAAIAFANANVNSFEERFAEHIDCLTVHSIGNTTIKQHFGVNRTFLEQYKYWKLFDALVKDLDLKRQYGDELEALKFDVLDVLHFVRVYLVDIFNDDAYKMVVDRFGLNPSKDIREYATKLLNEGNRLTLEKQEIDFDDMLYAPHYFNMTPPQYDVILADECQDFSPSQLDILIKMVKPNGLSVMVGDNRQSIYGFTGATEDSVEQIINRTQAEVLPLNTTFRCPKSHIIQVNEMYPDIGIVAYEANEDGFIIQIPESEIAMLAKPGDMIISRKTKDVIRVAFAILREGKHPKILGREMGASIVKPLEKMERDGDTDLYGIEGRVYDWYEDEYSKMEKQHRSKTAFAQLYERFESLLICVSLFKDECYNVRDLIGKIKSLFEMNGEIILSTIHRAKGAEAERVYIVNYSTMPMTWADQQAWELQQEHNIRYVAMTRSKHTLYLSDEAG